MRSSHRTSCIFSFPVLSVLASIGISFTDFNMLETPNFVGWRNYIKLLLDDDVIKKAFKNTIIFAVITGPLSYIMCLLLRIGRGFHTKLLAFTCDLGIDIFEIFIKGFSWLHSLIFICDCKRKGNPSGTGKLLYLEKREQCVLYGCSRR